MQIDWHNIIEACKKQDAAAQEFLYRHCYPGMIKICLRYCRGQADMAGSIYNQAMLKVFQHIDQYAGKNAVEAWIRRIVINSCIDHCRAEARFQSTELNESTTDLLPILPEAYQRINGNDILNLVHELPKNTGLVFNLYVMEGYKHEEIGRILGISTGTSKWHLNEARKLLKQKLDTLFKKEYLANAI